MHFLSVNYPNSSQDANSLGRTPLPNLGSQRNCEVFQKSCAAMTPVILRAMRPRRSLDPPWSSTEMWNNQTKSKLGFFVLFVVSNMFLSCKLYKGLPDRSTMFEGTAMSDAATSFKKKLGRSFKALSVQINHDSVTLRAQDPKQPANVDEYRYSAFLRSVFGPRPVELSSLENNLDNTLFDFDSVNGQLLNRTPAPPSSVLRLTAARSRR